MLSTHPNFQQLFLNTIDTWLDRKLMDSLASTPYFSVLADECVDISTTEELSICCRWMMVNGKPEEHFLTVLPFQMQSATFSSPRT